jgi:putative ABC transport system ATP-binding protein
MKHFFSPHQKSLNLMPDSTIRPIATKCMIRVANLSKRVKTTDGELIIVNDATFSVDAGEAVAVVGASGSGKSTLLGLMAGLDTPSQGKVFIGEEDLFALNEDGRAKLRGRLVGFVFQSFQLLPALNALENVMLPLELAGTRDAAQFATIMLGRVGLGERLGHYPKHLSGGEQQRVALARAFVMQPKLLLADEPTGNLDATTGAAVIDLMFALNAAAGTTLVLVTHDDAIARRCQRQIHLVGGRIRA